MFYKEEKFAIFIDGVHLFSASKALGFEIDYRLFRKEFMRRGRLLRIYYYTTILESEEFSPLRPLMDWLQYNGYHISTKPAREYTDGNGRRKVKGSIDLDLAVDALSLAGELDHVVLVTGDGDFVPLVRALQSKGVRVSVISTISSTQSMIADELRRQADEFIDLVDLQDVVEREERD